MAIKKLSNVIGAPFTEYVLRQLVVRAYRSSTGTTNFGPRTNDEVLYLANKTAWVRLISSVDLAFPPGSSNVTEDYSNYIAKLGIEGSGAYTGADSLAKNWILQAGTSKQNGNGITLRQGIGPDGAYGLGGTEELGYRPMPGLTSVNIETAGRLGSLRTATVNFKVWNMNQLNTIEALYFRLGYSMLLEWGHTQYFKNYGSDLRTTSNEGIFVNKEVYGIADPFGSNRRKEDIQQEIERKKIETSGNYDGMLGIVVNFNWSLSQDGGYDCYIRLVGLGAIIDSVRVNQSYKLPPGLLSRFLSNENDLNVFLQNQFKVTELKASSSGGGPRPPVATIDPIPKNADELLARETKYDNFNGDRAAFQRTYSPITFRSVAPTDDKSQNGTNLDFIARFVTPSAGITSFDSKEAQTKYGGLYLTRNGQFTYVGNAPTYVKLNIELLSRFIDGIVVEDLKPRTKGGILEKIDAPGVGTGNIETAPRASNFLNPIEYVAGQLNLPWNGFTVALAYDLSKTEKLYDVGAPSRVAQLSQVLPADAIPRSQGTINWNNELAITNGAEYEVFTNYQYNIPEGNTVDKFGVSVEEAVAGISNYSLSSGQALLTKVEFLHDPTKASTATFTVAFDVNIRSYFKGGTPTQEQAGSFDKNNILKDSQGRYYIDYKGQITLSFNNPAFILGLGTPPSPPSSGNTPGTGNAAADIENINKATTSEVNSALGYESALHAMLIYVQTLAQKAVLNKKFYTKADLTADTAKFYEDGALKGVLSTTPITTVPPDGVPFDLVQYAAKGFSSELMANPSKFAEIPYVKGIDGKAVFNSLCQALAVKYKQNNTDGLMHPGQFQVYIPLGYLLAFMNSMCLFYDSKQQTPATNGAGTEKRPYVYIDFNPETNFCLTSPQQLSIDPNVCLVPANLTAAEYSELFPPKIIPQAPLFNPDKENGLSQFIDSNMKLPFKSVDSAYRGKTMHILVCTQYLLRTLKEFATQDPQHAVALQPFLERVMTDINKALGNINLFRVAYRDDTNTVQIQDDQYVPHLPSETNMLEKEAFLTKLKTNVLESGELPIFGSQIRDTNNNQLSIPSLGIARELRLNTAMSSKLASMLAISAQAATGSVNAKDHSSLSWLNQNFRDRYTPYKQDPTNGASGTNNNPPPNINNQNTKNATKKEDPRSNDEKAADQLNNHIRSIYTSLGLSEDAFYPMKNYYIERMSKVKSNSQFTVSAPFIPAELELTLDGISGIIMGNAFNIPQKRLPLSLRGPDGFPKVGFIVTGLAHNIENNEWTTRIKGQMIKLREQSGLGTAVQTAQGQQSGVLDFTSGGASTTGGGSSRTPRNTDLFRNNNAAATSEYLLGKAKTIPNTPAHANWGGLKEIWQNANAWDLMTSAGTPVYAIVDGTVSGIYFSENRNTVWGYAFTLKGSTSSFFYTHLDSILVANGTSVTKGQLLGYIGQWPDDYTRLRNNPHLHIGVEVGKLLDYVDSNGKIK